MKKLSFILFVFCLIIGSCDNDETTKEEDSAKLLESYNDVITFSQANSQACNNADEWGFIKMDKSGCPENGYIVYSKKIDLLTLQTKIDQYNKVKENFHRKWGHENEGEDICGLKTVPTGVKCVDNKPQLSSDFVLY